MSRKRLFFDIETSPNIGFFWQPGRKITIDYTNIIKERAIICICYKWEGKKEVEYLTWDNKQCDKKMLQQFIKIANQADELVGHNGDKFDLAWVRTRCLFHKIPLFPEYITVDTLKIARSKFRFNSNKLNYIGQFLNVGKKIETSYDLWKKICLNKCKQSMAKMVRYCKRDVVLLEKVFVQMSPHIKVKQNWAMLFGQDKYSCSNCGSDDLLAGKTRYTVAGTERKQFQCNTCHHYTTLTVTNQMSKAHDKARKN